MMGTCMISFGYMEFGEREISTSTRSEKSSLLYTQFSSTVAILWGCDVRLSHFSKTAAQAIITSMESIACLPVTVLVIRMDYAALALFIYVQH